MAEQAEPVLSAIGTASWTHEEGIAYEVALEGINHVIGAYAGLIADRRESAPDSPDIDEWQRQQDLWEGRRRGLHPDDPQAVGAVRSECKQLLAELRAELRG